MNERGIVVRGFPDGLGPWLVQYMRVANSSPQLMIRKLNLIISSGCGCLNGASKIGALAVGSDASALFIDALTRPELRALAG